jgi:hypothetical protein
MFDWKGKFEILEHIDGQLRPMCEPSYNRITYDGREKILDELFGVESWTTGTIGYDGTSPASGSWHPYRTVAIGTVADDNTSWMDNAGYLTGGSGIKTSVIATGNSTFAHFPNLTDSYMSSALSGGAAEGDNVGLSIFYKRADRTIRTGRTITIEATFETTDDILLASASKIVTGTEIRELGIFSWDDPSGQYSPSSVRTQRPQAMICRSVRYQVSGGYIEDNPITIGANNITVRYTFGEEV